MDRMGQNATKWDNFFPKALTVECSSQKVLCNTVAKTILYKFSSYPE